MLMVFFSALNCWFSHDMTCKSRPWYDL